MLREKFRGTNYISLKEKRAKAQVYLIQYVGFSPVKHQVAIPIPLPDGNIVQLAFPTYDKRVYEDSQGILKAVTFNNQLSIQSETKLTEDIGSIAIQNLDNRKTRIIAKSVGRAVGKYIVEKTAERSLEHKYGEDASVAFKLISSIYNIASEQADLRSWQTLPDQIRVARLILKPGDYELFFDQLTLGQMTLHAGETKFLILRTSR